MNSDTKSPLSDRPRVEPEPSAPQGAQPLSATDGFPRYGASGCVLLHNEIDVAIDNICMAAPSGTYTVKMLDSIKRELSRLTSPQAPMAPHGSAVRQGECKG